MCYNHFAHIAATIPKQPLYNKRVCYQRSNIAPIQTNQSHTHTQLNHTRSTQNGNLFINITRSLSLFLSPDFRLLVTYSLTVQTNREITNTFKPSEILLNFASLALSLANRYHILKVVFKLGWNCLLC